MGSTQEERRRPFDEFAILETQRGARDDPPRAVGPERLCRVLGGRVDVLRAVAVSLDHVDPELLVSDFCRWVELLFEAWF